MEFIQPICAANTPEIYTALCELGYKETYINDSYNYIIASDKIFATTPYEMKDSTFYVNCGTNIDLVRAIAALREDTDVNQWFTYDGQFVICTDERWLNGENDEVRNKWHKATVKELFAKFG